MIGFIKNNIAIFVKTIILLVLAVLIIVLSTLKNNPVVCEWFSRNIQRWYLFGMGKLTSNIPFSIMEIVTLVLIILTIILLVSIIKSLIKLRLFKALSKVLSIVIISASVFLLFNVSMALGYNRAPLDIELYSGEIDKNQFKQKIQYFLDDFNDISDTLEYTEEGEVVSPYDIKELSELLKVEYSKLTSDYYMEYTVNLKPMLSSFIYREFQITGITFGITGEANINTKNTNGQIPFAGVHEIAHTKGVLREEDADLLSANLLLRSDNPFLRYSAYLATFTRLLDLANYIDEENCYQTLLSSLSPNIRKNYSYINNYWSKHDLLGKVGDFINDLYLKFNGEQEGSRSYGDSITEVDEHDVVIALSNYQSIYFKIYEEKHSI